MCILHEWVDVGDVRWVWGRVGIGFDGVGVSTATGVGAHGERDAGEDDVTEAFEAAFGFDVCRTDVCGEDFVCQVRGLAVVWLDLRARRRAAWRSHRARMDAVARVCVWRRDSRRAIAPSDDEI